MIKDDSKHDAETSSDDFIVCKKKKTAMQCLEEQFQLLPLINLDYTSFVTIESFVRTTNGKKARGDKSCA